MLRNNVGFDPVKARSQSVYSDNSPNEEPAPAYWTTIGNRSVFRSDTDVVRITEITKRNIIDIICNKISRVKQILISIILMIFVQAISGLSPFIIEYFDPKTEINIFSICLIRSIIGPVLFLVSGILIEQPITQIPSNK